mgnify:FL=1
MGFKIIVSLIALFSLTACDSTTVDIQNNSLIEPDHEYEIDTWGSNSEVYEFTPRSNTQKVCVMLMLDSGIAVALQCFDKGAS